MMSGCENYTKAIEFASPAYLPCEIRLKSEKMYEQDVGKFAQISELQERFPDDILNWVPCRIESEPVVEDNTRRWYDEWGTGWINEGHGVRTEYHPLESGYEQLKSYTFPDPDCPSRFEVADPKLKNRGDRYTQTLVWYTLFERLWMLRGFNNMLIDPYIETANFCHLRDQVLEIQLAMVDYWLARNVDGIFFSDDWGTQTALMMNPDDWRKFYKPSYRRLFRRVRDGGAHVWMHLCGNITAILPDLVEIGLNVLNPVQSQAMDVEALSREFGGKLCFYGGVDVQGTMIHGSVDDVKREIHELVELFGRFGGGYIGSTSHNTVMPETPLDNIIALYAAFSEYL